MANDRARDLLTAIDRDPGKAVGLITRAHSYLEALRTVEGKGRGPA